MRRPRPVDRGPAATAQPLWRPDPARIRNANLTRFAAPLGFEPPDYATLHDWSVAEREAFWGALWDFCGIVGERGGAVLEDGERFPGSRWFPGARLNYAENLLARRSGTAIVSVLENGERRSLGYGELARATAAFRQTLRGAGVGPGDRVAGWLPNVPETVVAMLASASLGAVWSSCSPDFGARGAADRFGQIRPKVLIACDGYRYGGKQLRTRERALAVARSVDSIEHLLWYSMDGEDDFSRALAEHGDAPLAFERLAFDHPLFILYSSGTTGKPKCIVHGAGGTLLQHQKEHRLHGDLTADDTLFFFTTCGWMMWNWLVSALAVGCAIVLYEGSPLHPGAARLIDLAEREAVTAFGVGARYLTAIERAGVEPRRTHDLRTLRSVLSTGSPLSHESFRYVYRDVKEDVHLASICGGTDLISCFALGCPWLPVRAGELQCAGLGMAVDVFDADGRSLRGAAGASGEEGAQSRKGELVCTRSFPSAPVGFWNDPGDARYLDAYFRTFAGSGGRGIWAHGDFAEITGSGGYIVHGRSDAVLNPGGVRIGTAEIYRQVEAIAEVADAVAIGQQWDGDTRIVLFVALRDGARLDARLRERIARRIRENASPRHVPAVIAEVPDVPRTRSGKIAELAVRDAVRGAPIGNAEALANPEALAAYRDRPELRRQE